jgi:hypothetical protein
MARATPPTLQEVHERAAHAFHRHLKSSNPKDGAMYVSIGGRKTQSALYRVTYVGSESTSLVPQPKQEPPVRGYLEAFHDKQDATAIEVSWLHLGDADRNLRFAARIALEHQPVASWKDKALSEANPRAALTALMALARSSSGDKALQKPILDALGKIDFKSLKGLDRVTLIRDYMLVFTRLGEPDAATKAELITKLNPLFPTNDTGLNRDLTELLVYLGDAGIVAKAAPLVNDSPMQEEQIDYAASCASRRQAGPKNCAPTTSAGSSAPRITRAARRLISSSAKSKLTLSKR